MIKHYFKVAFRNLWKYKTQNVISVIGLAVGILCFTVCFYCSRFANTVNHCFSNYERIAFVTIHDNSNRTFSGSPVSLYERLSSQSIKDAEAITYVAFAYERPFNVEISQDKQLPYDLQTIEVDSFYNRVFTPHLIAGNWKSASRAQNSVILSQSTAKKIFGNVNDAIGKHLTLLRRLSTSPESTPKTGGIVYTVQAVMKDIPQNNEFSFMKHVDMLSLNDSEGLIQSDERFKITGGNTYILLSSGTTVTSAKQQFDSHHFSCEVHGKKYNACMNEMGDLSIKVFSNMLVWVTGIIGILILLVGLINFFHFLVGSFFNRIKEFSILKVEGCSSKELFFLLFTQSAIVIFISVFISFWGFELIGNHLDFSFSDVVAMTFDKNLLFFQLLQYFLLLILLCAVICLIVAVHIRKIAVQDGIYGGRKRRGKHVGRNFLLGIQFFICWMFIVLSVALYLQSEKTSSTLLNSLTNKEKASVLSIPLDYSFLKNEDRQALVQRFKQNAGVKEMLLTDISVFRGISGNVLQTEKGNSNSEFDVYIMAVPKNFFSFMDIPIKQGKTFQTEKDMVIDETFVKKNRKNRIGATYYNSDNDFTVCGVCPYFTVNVYNQSPGYVFILNGDSTGYIGHCYLKCYPNQQKKVEKWILQVCHEMLPENITPKISTLLDDIHFEQSLESTLKGIILFFAVVSIIITLLGVYSSITLDTERRQKEVAIRKVNGASVRQIMMLFARLYIVLLLSSAIVAFPLTYLILTFWKRMYIVFFNYGFLFWLGIFAVVTLITAVTVAFRILRISRINPAEIIKSE